MQNGNPPRLRFLRRILVALLAVAVVIVAYPTRSRTELTVQALWASVPARDPTEARTASDALIPIDLDDEFAYLTAAGRVVYRGRTAYRVALSPAGFVNYSRTPSQLVVQYPDGDYRSTLPIAGYPMFVASRLFVVSDGGGTLSEWDPDGELLWRRELPAPLLSLDSSSRYLALGPIVGGPMVFDGDRGHVELLLPQHAERSVVYRVVLGETPDRLAILSGSASSFDAADGTDDADADADSIDLDFTLFELSAGTAVPLARRTITGAANVATFVRLFDDGRALYALRDPEPTVVGLGPEGGAFEYSLALRHPAREAIEPDQLPLHGILSTGESSDPARGFMRPAELTLVDRGGRVAARAAWAADATSISQHRWDGHVALTTIRIDDRVLTLRFEVR